MSQDPTSTDGVHQAVPILGRMGIEVRDVAPGHASVVLPHEPNSNHVGTTYAGSLFSACECLGGLVGLAAFGDTGAVPVVTQMNIDYLRPVLTDLTVSVSLPDSEIERLRTAIAADERAEFLLDSVGTTPDGKEACRATGTYRMITL